MRNKGNLLHLSLLLTALWSLVATTGCSSKSPPAIPFLNTLTKVNTIASTVPENGDVNPYGVALIPASSGTLTAGNYLVSNFNNSANLQGTGSTIVQISPSGTVSLFAQIPKTVVCPGGIGLTTALVALQSGFVVVGSLPTTDGTSATAGAGCLIVLDSSGSVVQTIVDPNINGPWDMTARDNGSTASLFVSNVLNGTVAANGSVVNNGTVVRVDLSMSGGTPVVSAITVIASGFPQKTDASALVIGVTGLAFDSRNGNLYVADSLSNRIASIANAATASSSIGSGTTIISGNGLNDPLGLTIAPSRNLIAANGSDGNLVEIDQLAGSQVAIKSVDSSGGTGAGALFGLITSSSGVYFVDDATNTFNLYQP